MSKNGTITFKQKDDNGLFMYSYEISNYHAAKILEYIALIPHKSTPLRDSKGRFYKPMIKRLATKGKSYEQNHL